MHNALYIRGENTNPFILGGSSPPVYPDKGIFDKINDINESALIGYSNFNDSFLTEQLVKIVALQSTWDVIGTLTFTSHLNKYSWLELNSVSESIRKLSDDDSKLLLEPVPKGFHKFDNHGSELLTVKDLAARYDLNKNQIYIFIKSDPSFPYKNIGLKKKLVINVADFETWLNDRTAKEKAFNLKITPATELLERFRK